MRYEDTPPYILLRKFVLTMPRVKNALRRWARLTDRMPELLRTQALSSIEHKAFHCLGGSIYAHYPGVDRDTMICLIVAFQTLSDYLDNLCDRLQISDPDAFRLLHTSFTDALKPNAPLRDYYRLYPYKEDIYLPSLVRTCQDLITKIPHFPKVQATALDLAGNYCELQTLKHVSQEGEDLLKEWLSASSNLGLRWYEWAAACGSTLGIFLLFAVGYNPPEIEEKELIQAYFPWIQGLHILLDYLIDLGEDKENGDLNFVAFYPTEEERDLSLCRFANESKRLAKHLPNPRFHSTVVEGLIALYGSDPKVRVQKQEVVIQSMANSGRSLFWLKLCKGLRSIHVI